MAKKEKVVEVIKENIDISPLEEVMGDRYATYAKYVIQDRAIPDVRDGLKPVQRRIIYSMYLNNNVSTKPTRKCAKIVGDVMGNYHPHGDTSIYEALARLSQDWKIREPLIDFQGNNGSIDGDVPAAYRYTEARLSQIADELVRDLDKKTVDMNLTFADDGYEPDVLPARFPNLLVNGSEGIAVAMATEIPPHNLREVIDATIYKIEHRDATVEDLRQFILGPDFPTGGVIYKSEGLDQIYRTGRGKIEVASKYEIVEEGNTKKIVITEIPYKVVKIQLVHEIDVIRHNKTIDGILSVIDESDMNGLRIVVELKKDAKADKILAYLMKATQLKVNYSPNIVAICYGRPKTLPLDEILEAYVTHQIDVNTRKFQFDLEKNKKRLHIVQGIEIAINNYQKVVEIIQRSKDKADAKVNLEKEFNLSEEQSEAIVMLPLYKLSHTDVNILINERISLTNTIAEIEEILADPKKLNRVIINDLKAIAKKYGSDRRTHIIDKDGEEITFNKRDLIAEEDVMVAITRDGYVKRSSVKSYRSSDNSLPGLKDRDVLVYQGLVNTKDYLLAFTNKGNYLFIPVYETLETKWKDEGKHINHLISINSNEDKIIKVIPVKTFRDDLYLVIATRKGQIKRTRVSDFYTLRYARPQVAMKIQKGDEIVSVEISNGNSNVIVFATDGNTSCYNENNITPTSPRASGIKAMSLKGAEVAAALTFAQDEKSKLILITDAGHIRIYDSSYSPVTNRLNKPFTIFRCFKNEIQRLVFVKKILDKNEVTKLLAYTNTDTLKEIEVNDYHLTPLDKYATKSSIGLTKKVKLVEFFNLDNNEVIDNSIESDDVYSRNLVEQEVSEEVSEEEPIEEHVEQISIFDDDDLE